MIKQTLEKVLDKDTSLAERIRILFRKQGITIFSILTALSKTISTIILANTDVFGGGEGQEVFHQKMKVFLKNG